MAGKKLWAGRFQRGTDKVVEEFTSSIHFDKRLYAYDIRGSVAHARMLARQGVISEEEAEAIVAGLGEILREIEHGEFEFSPELEDIHMNVESRLIEKIGSVGEKLHTARSRNDQIALDIRLYLRDQVEETMELLAALKEVLLNLAEDNLDTVMPGFTHMQHAQPVLFAHHVLAYVEMFSRDEKRLSQCLERIQVMPLGSAALAGTPFDIDRHFVAQELGFDRISRNSMDAVSDRDFALDFIYASSVIMTHLSRFAEELVIWTTSEFAFVEMSDAVTTGSSIMPQKKNPDVAELIRGKTGRVYGDLMALLTILKGLPLTYNRDLQEDKEPVFDAVDTVMSCLRVFIALLEGLTVNKERMESATSEGFLTATDIADYLVRKEAPFRRAHHIVGEIVAYCIQKKKMLQDLTLPELQEFSKLFDEDVFEVIGIRSSINSRAVFGGTAAQTVKAAIEEARKRQ